MTFMKCNRLPIDYSYQYVCSLQRVLQELIWAINLVLFFVSSFEFLVCQRLQYDGIEAHAPTLEDTLSILMTGLALESLLPSGQLFLLDQLEILETCKVQQDMPFVVLRVQHVRRRLIERSMYAGRPIILLRNPVLDRRRTPVMLIYLWTYPPTILSFCG